MKGETRKIAYPTKGQTCECTHPTRGSKCEGADPTTGQTCERRHPTKGFRQTPSQTGDSGDCRLSSPPQPLANFPSSGARGSARDRDQGMGTGRGREPGAALTGPPSGTPPRAPSSEGGCGRWAGRQRKGRRGLGGQPRAAGPRAIGQAGCHSVTSQCRWREHCKHSAARSRLPRERAFPPPLPPPTRLCGGGARGNLGWEARPRALSPPSPRVHAEAASPIGMM